MEVIDCSTRRALMTKKFADDSKIANKAVSQEDREVMQDCIDNFLAIETIGDRLSCFGVAEDL